MKKQKKKIFKKQDSIPEPWTCNECEALNDCDNLECGYCEPENVDDEKMYSEYDEDGYF